MNTHEVEFQRFLQKMEFFDNVWKQLVEQRIEDNLVTIERSDQHNKLLKLKPSEVQWRLGTD